MMPEKWVKDEKIWQKAKKAFKKQYDKEPEKSSDYAIVTSIYKKMGGEISSEALNLARTVSEETLIKVGVYREKLKNLGRKIYEML